MNFDSNYKQQRKIIYAQLSLSLPTLFSHFFYVTFVAFFYLYCALFVLNFRALFYALLFDLLIALVLF